MSVRQCVALATALTVVAGSAVRADMYENQGQYIATVAGCVGCHTANAPGSPLLSGGKRFGVGATAPVSANLTPDRQTGLGTWTDAELTIAIRKGIRPDGTRIARPMPQRAYAGLSDADVGAVVAYLRSVPAVHNAIEHHNSAEVSVHDDQGEGGKQKQSGSASDVDRRGRYLFTSVTHCGECHLARDVRTDGGGQGSELRSFRGKVVAPILSSHAVASFSDAALERIIRFGRRPDNTSLEGPMPVAAYEHLTSDDLAALIAYIRTL